MLHFMPHLENSVCCLWDGSWRVCWHHVSELFGKITHIQFIADTRFKGCCYLLLSQQVPVNRLSNEKDCLMITTMRKVRKEKTANPIQQIGQTRWHLANHMAFSKLRGI